jgi:hypothetical protein
LAICRFTNKIQLSSSFKEQRDELSFFPKAAVATVVNAAANAAAPNRPQIPTIKHVFSLKREGMHKQRDGKLIACCC